MNSATIAAALATIYGAATPPAGEPAIALATHLIPDEIKGEELPALLVWPPDETIAIASRLDHSLQAWPVVLYLGRGDRTTQQRVAAVYGWRDALRTLLERTHVHLSAAGVTGVAAATTGRVTVNAREDMTFGLVDYDTVRLDVAVKISEGIVVTA